MALSTREVYKRTIESSLWMTLNIFVQRGFGILTFLIVSRFILPEDYGILTAAMIVVGFVNVVSQTGFEAALIQTEDKIERYLNKVWTINIMRGVFLFMIIYFTAPWTAALLNIEGHEAIIRFAGLYPLLEAFNNIGIVYFSKDINFKMIFFRDLGTPVAFLVFSLIWVTFDPSVWALAAGHLGSYLWSMIASYFLSAYRPRFDFKFKELMQFFHFSKWVVAGSLANYINNAIDGVFLSNLLGPERLGIYSKARDFSIIPSSYVAQISMKVGFPSISKIQHEPETIRGAFSKLYELTLFLSLPFSVILFTQAHHLIDFLLVDVWQEVVFPLKFLLIAMMFRGFIIISSPLFNGLGKPNLYFSSIVIQIITSFFALLYLVPRYDIMGAAYATILAMGITFLFTSFQAIRLTKLNVLTLIPSTVLIVVASTVMAMASIVFNRYIPHPSIPVYGLFLIGLGLLYLVQIVLFAKKFNLGPAQILLDMTRRLFEKKSVA